jgi:two-component system, NarL family, response regulator NreC
VTTTPKIGSVRVEPATRSPVRVVVAEKHALMRRGLRLLLEHDAAAVVVGEASDLAGVMRRVQALRPEVLVIDMSMSNGSSLEVIRLLRQEAPATQIVVLTLEESRVFAQAVLDAGAIGFVLKQAADSELAAAVRSAAAGERFESPRLARLNVLLGRSALDT